MHSLKVGIVNELYMLLYRKKTIVLLCFSALLPIVLALSLHKLQPLMGLVAVSKSFPIEMLGFYTALWIPIFIFLTAADLFPNEVSSRTLKLSLLRPITRFRVFAAKASALLIAIAAILFLLGIVTVICSLALGSEGSFNIVEVVKAYSAAWLSMAAVSALFIFVAQFFNSASGCFAFSILLYIAAKIAPFFTSVVSSFSPVSYTDWHLMWLNSTVSPLKLMTTSVFLLSSCILFFSLGYFIFNRKEV
ncbi:ABC transporter permease subunit [Paenibacillus sp. RC67]|uniref:ABC transporter permease subunit n=1 Tax=Paenibacillus sp. RC67 TaxID=3039392 RepID=UPI0024ADACC8|nr:ABC transporter permease subunit [Paenibacillus sp. RC67]